MIRKLLLCSGVQGSRKALGWLRNAVVKRRPEAILFAGGITNAARPNGGGATPWSLTSEDTRFVEEFFATLGGLGEFTAVIPGPKGEPLEEFLRLGMQAELTHPTIHIAHATLIEQHDLAVCGIGGVMGENTLIGLDSYSRITIEYFLRPLWKAKKPRKILLLAAAPPGRLGGIDGVPLVGDLIDSFHPDLCVVAGSSERRGAERSSRTLVVNPGCLADGCIAWVDWSRAASEEVEFADLRELETHVVPG